MVPIMDLRVRKGYGKVERERECVCLCESVLVREVSEGSEGERERERGETERDDPFGYREMVGLRLYVGIAQTILSPYITPSALVSLVSLLVSLPNSPLSN